MLCNPVLSYRCLRRVLRAYAMTPVTDTTTLIDEMEQKNHVKHSHRTVRADLRGFGANEDQKLDHQNLCVGVRICEDDLGSPRVCLLVADL